MIKNKYYYGALFQSWENCYKDKLSKDIERPLISLTKDEIAKKQKENSKLILKFLFFLDNHMNAIKHIKGDYHLILFDNEGYILNTRKVSGKGINRFISIGASFSEASIGTNAVAFAMKFNSPVYMYPNYHYCDKLKNWYEYCAPVKGNGITTSYISIIGEQYCITKALEGFVNLLQANICDKYYPTNDMLINCNWEKRLTERQYVVLKLIAEGLSDEDISNKLKISLSTVKYHNQSIFKQLDASSRVQAVMKAIILNELDISDISDIIE